MDADEVDGYDANQVSRAALGTMTGAGTLTTSYQSLGSVTITAPRAGFVIVTGSTTVYSFNAACGCEITAGLATSATGIPDAWSNARVGLTASSTDIATISVPHVFSVAAGTHTFHMVAQNHGAATGLASATFGGLVAQFTPFGSAGGATLGTADGSPTSTDTELSD